MSEDGKRWVWVSGPSWLKFGRAVRVGVFVASTAPGKVQVRFDRFRLTRPTK